MKLFKKGYEVLSSKAKLKLKVKMGFPITLSDIEAKPITKKIIKCINKRRGWVYENINN